jgi:crossover junction endodeoxyribonuclease RuvC
MQTSSQTGTYPDRNHKPPAGDPQQMNIRIAIDPGAGGGIAWIDSDGIAQAERMPENAAEVADLLRSIAATGQTMAVVESVHAMPGNGATSMFSFGQNFGVILGCLAALGIPHYLETPQRWQKRVGVMPSDKTERKSRLKEYSAALFPHLKVTLATSDCLAMLAVMQPPGEVA